MNELKDWIYDLVDSALYDEVYSAEREVFYDWVTDRVFKDAVEDCAEFLRDSGELPISNPNWRDEENAHLMVDDWITGYFR